MKYFVSIVIACVSVVFVVALVMAGSPQTARKQRIDSLRLDGLSSLNWTLENYANETHALPESLDQLTAENWIDRLPTDPETGELYAYKKIDDTHMQLCTTFYFASKLNQQIRAPKFDYATPNQYWDHEAGYVCFDRTVSTKNPISPVVR